MLATGVDWVALSFIQRPEDLAEARKIARGRALLMSKIEKPQAVARLAEIIELSDALMVARGDLGVEMPLEAVPGIQKQITRAARRAGKPVVVATQMLESMITAPVPTRAEVSDVATAVFEGADAIMLSAESAAGQYPVEAVATMNRIAERGRARPELCRHHQRPALRARGDRRRRDLARRAPDRRDAEARGDRHLHGVGHDRPARRARAAAGADHRAVAGARHRPAAVARSGARIASCRPTPATSTTWSTAPAASPIEEGFAKPGDRIIITAGVPLRTPGSTNMLRIAYVGSESGRVDAELQAGKSTADQFGASSGSERLRLAARLPDAEGVAAIRARRRAPAPAGRCCRRPRSRCRARPGPARSSPACGRGCAPRPVRRPGCRGQARCEWICSSTTVSMSPDMTTVGARDLAVARRVAARMRVEPGDVDRIGAERRRPQHQRDRGDVRIVRRHLVRREHACRRLPACRSVPRRIGERCRENTGRPPASRSANSTRRSLRPARDGWRRASSTRPRVLSG